MFSTRDLAIYGAIVGTLSGAWALSDRAGSQRNRARKLAARRPAREGVRTAVAAARRGARVTVRCGECGSSFALSVRREYAHRKAGRDPKCSTCRRPREPMSDEERARCVSWWLNESGVPLEELARIAVYLGTSDSDAASPGV